ncbi:TSL-kinase interacting protein [Dionaea muscipula]
MQTETEISLDCEVNLLCKSNLSDDGGLVAVPSSYNHADPQPPAKRPTRQWAAWTRIEEESFFTALRQVGKNFEKITYRVQSKNKDQVRHYYYRLVRRMNKLLGPGFSLDAKNSKDTNAAMLRWWSLLEKYSCKASKLHLKPRRFKIFMEALEHQLRKDRKKNVKKRSSHGENISDSSLASFPSQSKPSGNDSRAVKLVLVDSQNIQKSGHARSVRRNTHAGVCRKRDTSPTKASRQHRKSAAVKRWEKAAISGMSLVADAAEHLERIDGDKEARSQGALNEPSVLAAVVNNEQCGLGISGQGEPHGPNASGTDPALGILQNATKLKLQLFPINESTKRTLEMDKHNPHLELTMSMKKKISSVLEHLSRKWGNSSVACGELMLFPYNGQSEYIMQIHRWTRDSTASAADVYASVGNPPVFRLRYGWILSTELQAVRVVAPLNAPEKCNMHENNVVQPTSNLTSVPASCVDHLGKAESNCEDQRTLASHIAAAERSPTEVDDEITGYAGSHHGDKDCLFKSSTLSANMAWQRCHASIGTATRESEIMVDQRVINGASLSPGEWADTLTNISIGDLLQEASDNIHCDCGDSHARTSTQCVEEIPFTCDSFDAAIAAHISRHQDRIGFQFQSSVASHSASIWDAEETRDAFSFQKRSIIPSISTVSVTCEGLAQSSSAASGYFNENSPKPEAISEDAADIDPMEECLPETEELADSGKEFSSLADIYWPDSLGPLDLDTPSCKYYSEELILSDSLSSVNRLLASGLDAIHSCSFFGVDKKAALLTTEVQGDASLKDIQVGGSGGNSVV